MDFLKRSRIGLDTTHGTTMQGVGLALSDEQMGTLNPFKPGELMDVAARPASNKVKVRPLKGLKEMV